MIEKMATSNLDEDLMMIVDQNVLQMTKPNRRYGK